MNTNKHYVRIRADFSKNGTITPVCMITENGVKHDISRVTNIMTAASRKSGGLGTRYTCYIGTRMFYLFLEEDRWFWETPEAN